VSKSTPDTSQTTYERGSFGGRSSPISQPIVFSVVSGSGPSHSKHVRSVHRHRLGERGRQLRRALLGPLCPWFRWSLCQRLVGQFAPWTFKRAQIGTSKAGLDTDQRHANLAIGTARPLDRARGMRFRHVCTPLDQAGAQHSQSPITAEGGSVMSYPTPANVARSRRKSVI
jgi:hypothetical protein